MDVRVGVLFLFVLAASWACDARQLTNLDLSVSKSGHLVETQTFQVEEVVGNEKACTLCEEFAGQALDYIGENKTQTEIIEYLHQTCSQLRSFKQQCVTLVDYYAPLFFLEVSSLEPAEFCQKLEIIELLLKACSPVEYYNKKCKKLVFKYAPLMLANAEQYLEATDICADICTALHDCNSNTASIMEHISNLSDS